MTADIVTVAGIAGIVGMLYRISRELGGIKVQLASTLAELEDHETRLRGLEKVE